MHVEARDALPRAPCFSVEDPQVPFLGLPPGFRAESPEEAFPVRRERLHPHIREPERSRPFCDVVGGLLGSEGRGETRIFQEPLEVLQAELSGSLGDNRVERFVVDQCRVMG